MRFNYLKALERINRWHLPKVPFFFHLIPDVRGRRGPYQAAHVGKIAGSGWDHEVTLGFLIKCRLPSVGMPGTDFFEKAKYHWMPLNLTSSFFGYLRVIMLSEASKFSYFCLPVRFFSSSDNFLKILTSYMATLNLIVSQSQNFSLLLVFPSFLS